jgi:hypothetical protein
LRYFTLAGINGITKFLSKNQFVAGSAGTAGVVAAGTVGRVAAGPIGSAGGGATFSFDGLFSPLQIQHLMPSLP